MILFFYFIVNVMALFLFVKKKKHLHILEIFMYWLIGSYLFQNFSAFCFMNLKTLLVPENLVLELTHFLNRIVLFPLVMVLFLHYLLIMNTYVKKFLLIIGFVLLLAGMEGLADLFGIIQHVNWKVWWSLSFWLGSLMILIGFMKFFRRMLFKGDRKI